MSSYLKPQSPLYHKKEDAYFYPLTTADQIITEDGNRLTSLFKKTIKENVTLLSSNWSEYPPYTQTITLLESTDDYNIDSNIVYSGIEADIELNKAVSCLSYVKKNHKEIIFYCLKKKPVTDIPVEIIGTCRNTIAELNYGIDTSDATATSDKILEGESAYVNGVKVIGNIPVRDSNDLDVNDAIITIPAGYYGTEVNKSVEAVEQATPSISVSSSGLITASVEQTKGYVIGDTKSITQQLNTKAATTITPSTLEQTAVASGVYTTGEIKVAAMPTATQATPSISVNSSGLITASATQTAGYVSAGTKSATKQLTVQAAKTITPSTSSQTAVASGRYTTGAVTVAAIPSSYKQLNFTVVGGTTQPTNPTENMIWVNTSTTITGYRFSATEPENMVEGEVWIKTGDDSSASFDIIDDIKLCPLYVKQYVDGAWVDKTAMSYLNSEWIDWRIYIYNVGDDGNALYVYTPSGSYAGRLSTVFDSDGILLKSTSSSGTYGVRIGTNNTIDFTNYSKLYAKIIFNNIGSNGKNIWNALAVTTNRSGQSSNFLASADYPNPSVGEHIYEVDISNINTSGYVEYCMDAYSKTVDAKITGIWLKY